MTTTKTLNLRISFSHHRKSKLRKTSERMQRGMQRNKNKNYFTPEFLETMQARKEWSEIYKVLRGKKESSLRYYDDL